MKKVLIAIGTLIVAGLIAWGAFSLGVKNTSSQNNSSNQSVKKSQKMTSSTTSMTGASVTSSSSQKHTAFGGQGAAEPTTPSSESVADATSQLRNAGFPVDQWAPSDIQKIVSDASQQGISVVDYAKQNFHQ
ncbi:hypothetical protein [Fructobacillus papyrifericola]|uniref:Lipoprotein n=1 Tax=Fructobacillus papyrifericola TaxID=2713172 RepID=A0ABS5QTP9_9LACO|nr:hypothetical protein [Fructobacillus papyrifericola]MBS9335776.1 hypothetical protein [Fructobacillus papyrifericola]